MLDLGTDSKYGLCRIYQLFPNSHYDAMLTNQRPPENGRLQLVELGRVTQNTYDLIYAREVLSSVANRLALLCNMF